MEYISVTLGYGFRVYPAMFGDWTGLTQGMIESDFEDVLTEYNEYHPDIRWVDYGNSDNIEYYIMSEKSIRYCDGLIPAPIDLPARNYEKNLRESVHKLNVKQELQWYLGMFRW